MSNFYQRRVAQENAFVETSVYTVYPEDGAFRELAEAEARNELLDKDLEQLDDDANRLDTIIEQAEITKPLAIAHESIRRRWGFKTKRTVGHESVKDTVKGLVQRFIAWVREKAVGAKDLVMKFYNAGRTIQKNARKYKERVAHLGHIRTEYIDGRFIERLLLSGEFIGADIAKMKSCINLCNDCVKGQKALIDATVAEINKDIRGDRPNYGNALSADGIFGKTSKVFGVVGHRNLVAEHQEDENGHSWARLVFPPTLREDIPPRVFTPKKNQLLVLIDYYYNLGRELEREITNQQYVDKQHLKLADVMEKLLLRLEKLERADDTNELGRRTSRYARAASTKASILGSVNIFAWRNLTAGLGGYIAAALEAFSH